MVALRVDNTNATNKEHIALISSFLTGVNHEFCDKLFLLKKGECLKKHRHISMFC